MTMTFVRLLMVAMVVVVLGCQSRNEHNPGSQRPADSYTSPLNPAPAHTKPPGPFPRSQTPAVPDPDTRQPPAAR